MMPQQNRKKLLTLEISLIIVTLGLTCLLYETTGYGVVVLNLFFLPIVLAGFFLGRYRAGVLSLLCALAVAGVVMLDMQNFSVLLSPIAIALSLTIWGAVLGLTAILVGTLSDECEIRTIESHEAHVGVVEVLARYLQSGNPRLQSRAMRMAELSEQVARASRLSEKEANDIRVAALLMDVENIEITSRVIRKAVGVLEDEKEQNTFAGSELVQSLGKVLTSAFPLLLNQMEAGEVGEGESDTQPFGSQILRTVKAYDDLVHGQWSSTHLNSQEALDELESDVDAEHHPAVLHALEKVLRTRDKSMPQDSEQFDEQPTVEQTVSL
jgi:hypothetical protein